jgi:hypothetical protein
MFFLNLGYIRLWESESEEFNQLPGYRGCTNLLLCQSRGLGCAVVALEATESDLLLNGHDSTPTWL